MIDLDHIKQLAIVGMFADEELAKALVLKGGNAIDLVYKMSARSSVDIDFSTAGEFPGGSDWLKQKVEAALYKTYRDEKIHAFDFKAERKPGQMSEDLKGFWGGYQIEFKLIAAEMYERNRHDLEALRRNAINLGQGTKFSIDVSCFEFLAPKVPHDMEGYQIFVYSPEMIVIEKLRALCQQMDAYSPIVKRGRSPTSRARDFVDIHLLITEFNIDLATAKNRDLLANIFYAKRVPIDFMNDIASTKALHEASFQAVKDTVKSGQALQSFDFYFNFVLQQVAKLQPLGDIQVPAGEVVHLAHVVGEIEIESPRDLTE